MSSPFEPAEGGGPTPLGKLPYERRRRDDTKQPAEPPVFEHGKWKHVRTGLTLMFWSWSAILAISACFLAFYVASNFLRTSREDPAGGQPMRVPLFETADIRTVGFSAVYAILVCLTVSFIGK